MRGPRRCGWVGSDPLMVEYHDHEWGVPLRDDQRLFEFLILDGAQAGLSWRTILHRRDGYRRAFSNFDPALVARFGEEELEGLFVDPGIIRNRAKLRSAVRNAKAFLAVQEEFGSFSSYLWSFVDGHPQINHFVDGTQIPAQTALSKQVSVELKRRGFSFVGPTIIYAYLQAAGLVNDHLINCFRHRQVQRST